MSKYNVITLRIGYYCFNVITNYVTKVIFCSLSNSRSKCNNYVTKCIIESKCTSFSIIIYISNVSSLNSITIIILLCFNSIRNSNAMVYTTMCSKYKLIANNLYIINCISCVCSKCCKRNSDCSKSSTIMCF